MAKNIEKHALIAFDGLPCAGISTLVEMLRERSEDAVVIREKYLDPLRPAIKKLEKLYNEGITWDSGLERLVDEFPDYSDTILEAEDYIKHLEINDPRGYCEKHAALAYLYATGRSYVNEIVKKAVESHDVILDTWQMTNWASQTCPLHEDSDIDYDWRSIRELNEARRILYPHMQIFVVCNLDEVYERELFFKQIGEEDHIILPKERQQIIYDKINDIHNWLQLYGMASVIVKSPGLPREDIKEQISQAVDAYAEVEKAIRDNIESKVMGVCLYRLSPKVMYKEELKEYFLQPEVIERIRKNINTTYKGEDL